jgi:hypothetical protein
MIINDILLSLDLENYKKLKFITRHITVNYLLSLILLYIGDIILKKVDIL